VKCLLHENVELRIGLFLRSLGHDVTSIFEDYPRSTPDDDVLAIAVAEDWVLVANDLNVHSAAPGRAAGTTVS
jgi:predicted nuclease of predicted toxin-antitoxin system